MQDLAIFGAGGMAREIAYMIKRINQQDMKYRFVGFVVDNEFYSEGSEVMGYPLNSKDWLVTHRDDTKCVCCIGYPKDRRKTMRELMREGIKFETLVDPTTYIGGNVNIGNGCIISGLNILTTDISIGDGVFLNGPMVTIGHDSVIEDYVTCFPKVQVSGGCHIGEAALIGAMSYIHEHKTIGEEAVVAPGSIVMRNVKSGMHAMGNPARVIKL